MVWENKHLDYCLYVIDNTRFVQCIHIHDCTCNTERPFRIAFVFQSKQHRVKTLTARTASHTHRDFHVESFCNELFNLVQLLLLQVNGYQQQQLSIRTMTVARPVNHRAFHKVLITNVATCRDIYLYMHTLSSPLYLITVACHVNCSAFNEVTD